MLNGWIYILKHNSGQNVKVGETRVSPVLRERDYVKTYKLRGFKLFKTFPVPINSRQDIEKRVHRKLIDFQLSGLDNAKEIFACSTDIAEKAILDSINESEIYLKELNRQKLQAFLQNNEEKIYLEKLDIETKFKKKITQNWEKSSDYKELLKEKKLQLKKHPYKRKIQLPFVYWFFLFVFVFNFILFGCGMIQNPELADETGFYIMGFLVLLIFLMIFFPSRRSSLNNKSNQMQNIIENKIKIKFQEFYKNEMNKFNRYYYIHRKLFLDTEDKLNIEEIFCFSRAEEEFIIVEIFKRIDINIKNILKSKSIKLENLKSYNKKFVDTFLKDLSCLKKKQLKYVNKQVEELITKIWKSEPIIPNKSNLELIRSYLDGTPAQFYSDRISLHNWVE